MDQSRWEANTCSQKSMTGLHRHRETDIIDSQEEIEVCNIIYCIDYHLLWIFYILQLYSKTYSVPYIGSILDVIEPHKLLYTDISHTRYTNSTHVLETCNVSQLILIELLGALIYFFLLQQTMK